MSRKGPLLGASWYYRQPRDLSSRYFQFRPGLGGAADAGVECRATFAGPTEAGLVSVLQDLRDRFEHTAVRLDRHRREGQANLFTVSMHSLGFFDWDFHSLSLIEAQLVSLGAEPQQEPSPITERHALLEIPPEEQPSQPFADRRFQLVAADTPSGAQNLCIRIDLHHARPSQPPVLDRELIRIAEGAALRFCQYKERHGNLLVFFGNGRQGLGGAQLSYSDLELLEREMTELVSSRGYEFGHVGFGFDRSGAALDEYIKLTKAPLKRLVSPPGEVDFIP